MHLHHLIRSSTLALGLSFLAACSTLHTTPKTALDKQASWVLVPAINNTETPQAGARLDSITASLLRSHGIQNLTYVGASENNDSLFDLADRRQQTAALAAAKNTGAKYAVAASVDEWRYKVGLDGEPAAGITLNIIEVQSGQVVWSGAAAKTGWSREAVSAVAQKVVNNLLNSAVAP
jgi:hypothetical protein